MKKNRLVHCSLFAMLLSACANSRFTKLRDAESLPPSWVAEPTSVQSDGTIRAVGVSETGWQLADAGRADAAQDGQRKVAKILGDTQLWSETLRYLRDHPVVDQAAKDLGLGEAYLRDTVYDMNSAHIPSVVVSRCWRDKEGIKAARGGVFCEVVAPSGKALAAIMEAKATGMQARLDSLKTRRALADSAEEKAEKAVEILMRRARELSLGGGVGGR